MENRYSRQENLKLLPKQFQKSIQNKHLTIIGCGGVGSNLAQLLVRGGFINLTLIDFDKIDITNLNRQAFFEKDINKYKTKTLKKHILRINSKANITIINKKLSITNINKIEKLKQTDLIVDATDSIQTRKIINTFCENNSKNWIYNGAIKSEAISCVFLYKNNNQNKATQQSKNLGIKDFEKIFPKNAKEEKAKDVGILPSTTYLAAALGFNQICKYFIDKKTNKKSKQTLIKINLWNDKLFKINLD